MLKNILLILATFFVSATHAQQPEDFGVNPDQLPKGLKQGAIAPNFTLLSEDGSSVNLTERLKDGPVVIMFYRGAWCPVCNRYLSRVVDSLSYIKDAGATVLAITPNKMEEVVKMSGELDEGLLLLSDKAGEVMKNYDVSFAVTDKYQNKIKTFLFTDIAEDNNQERARLPVPATYIINQNGEIIWRHFDLNYKNRASVKQILKHLP